MTPYNVEIGVAVPGSAGARRERDLPPGVTSFEIEAPQETGEDTLLELARAEFAKENEEPVVHTWLYFWEEADPQDAEPKRPHNPRSETMPVG